MRTKIRVLHDCSPLQNQQVKEVFAKEGFMNEVVVRWKCRGCGVKWRIKGKSMSKSAQPYGFLWGWRNR